MSEIKPCAFCGHHSTITVRLGNGEAGTFCNFGEECGFAPEKVWNTRPIEDALRAQLAEAEEQIKSLKSQLEMERETAERLILRMDEIRSLAIWGNAVNTVKAKGQR